MEANSKHLLTAERQTLEQLVHERSVASIAEEMGVTRETFARACAGLPVRRGSVALIRAALLGNSK